MSDIQAGLVDLVRVLLERQIRSVAVPAPGCGNGGLARHDLRALIEPAFASLPDVQVPLFPPDAPPDPADMPVVTAPVDGSPRHSLRRSSVACRARERWSHATMAQPPPPAVVQADTTATTKATISEIRRTWAIMSVLSGGSQDKHHSSATQHGT